MVFLFFRENFSFLVVPVIFDFFFSSPSNTLLDSLIFSPSFHLGWLASVGIGGMEKDEKWEENGKEARGSRRVPFSFC